MQRNSKPLTWRAKGLSDALDTSDTFPGAMASLQNLIPDPSTQTLWQCRPAAVLLTSTGRPFSSGFSSGFQQSTGPYNNMGFISCFRIVGSYAYGMVAQADYPGYDAPFCFDLIHGVFIPVTGVTSNTQLPLSPLTTGTWIPPSMAVVGSDLVVCSSGFTGAAGNYFGWFDISTPSAPTWNAGNLTGGYVSFTVAPTGVAQFSDRAYYIHNAVAQPAVIFSDPLFATQVSNANQILTFGDNVPLTALGGLPLNNELGGIIQSLIVFKNTTNMYQITGDSALSNLTLNSLNVATGTLAPNSVTPTPKGLAFVAPDGLRIVDFNANVSDPIGFDGRGVTLPFTYSSVPSRMCAACNGNLLRVTTQNGSPAAVGSPTQEYWYDFGRKVWSGPHTFPASLIESYNQTFIMTPTGVLASLWQSDGVQSDVSVFVENGQQLMWNWQTADLPDTEMLTNNCMTEASLDLALPPLTPPVTVVAQDQTGAAINSVAITSSGSATIWGSFVWGQALWGGGGNSALAPYQLPWTIPVVFSRLRVSVNGTSSNTFKIGALHMRYQILRQLVNTQAAA